MNNIRNALVKNLPEDLQEILRKLDGYLENRREMNNVNMHNLLGDLESIIDELEDVIIEIEEIADEKTDSK